jgi:hypothetical protein
MTVKITPQVFIDNSGNIERSKELIGFALNQREILNNLMSFNDLKQDQRKIDLIDGSVITIQSCFGIDKIWISSPPVTEITEASILPLYIAYFEATTNGGSYRVAFSWDIANDCYSSVTSNSGVVVKEDGRYYNGKKYDSNGLPYLWEISANEGLNGIEIFRRWMWEGFEFVKGAISSIENIGETQKVTANFDDLYGGNPVKLGQVSFASEDRMWDINAIVREGDYAINWNVQGGPMLWAKVITVTDTNSVIIDKQIFGLYGSPYDDYIVIMPFLLMFREYRGEGYSYGSTREFIIFNREPAVYPHGYHGPGTNFATLSTSDLTTAPGSILEGDLSGDPSKGGIFFTNYWIYPVILGAYGEGIIDYQYNDYILSNPDRVFNDHAVTETRTTTCFYCNDNNKLLSDKFFSYFLKSDWSDGNLISNTRIWSTSLGDFTTTWGSGTRDYSAALSSRMNYLSVPIQSDISVYNEKVIFQVVKTGEVTNPGYAAQSIGLYTDVDKMSFNTVRSSKLELALQRTVELMREANGENAGVAISVHLYRR